MEFLNRFFKKDSQAERPEYPQQREKIAAKDILAARTLASEAHPDHNEDRAWMNQAQGWLAVLDGMGGTHGGEQAAEVALQTLKEAAAKDRSPTTYTAVEAQLQKMLQLANQEIVTLRQQPGFEQSGSTLTMARVYDDEKAKRKLLTMISVGDSRIYRFREGRLQQLSQDDDLVNSMFEQNEANLVHSRLNSITKPEDLSRLSLQEQEFYRRRNVITKHLGMDELQAQPKTLPVLPGDQIFIFSDGITDNLTDRDMAQIIQETGGGQRSVDVLLQYALNASRVGKEQNIRSKKDDMTAVTLTVAKAEAPTPVRSTVEQPTEKRQAVPLESAQVEQALRQELSQTSSMADLESKVSEFYQRGIAFKDYTALQVEQQLQEALHRYTTSGDIGYAAAVVTRTYGLREQVRRIFPETLTFAANRTR
ncbi:MAG: serine/threonine-protein phosphatase [bacterium]|nr:serine/threonine-protein phosphatase [bacterium]